MDRQSAPAAADPALRRFARRLHERLGAEHVLLFGSRARGTSQTDSDYDLIVVAPAFEVTPRLQRGQGLRALFYESGGNAPLDLICLTPDEFAAARERITLVRAVLPESVELLSAPVPSSI